MANLLLLLAGRKRTPQPPAVPPPRQLPADTSTTDAVFLVLRRMRAPLVLLIVLFAISVAGLALIPGEDADGAPLSMSVFDAFYFMSYTATTIGFGELPVPFTTPQRMWVTVAIYSSVIGWAYAIGTLFALLQDHAFQEAIAIGRFRRRVRRMREPFLVVAGYGRTGRRLCRDLDALGRRTVVVDASRSRIDTLAADQLASDVPGLEGDVRNPSVLSAAGLGNPFCEGVVALTSSDDANLAVVMTVRLLRPDVPVIARCNGRAAADRMRDFHPAAVINPYDLYGTYLMLAVRRPAVFQLLTWLLSAPGTELPPRREGLVDGHWVICADGDFGTEVTADLRAAGLDVTLADPDDGPPDVAGAVGLVAGAERDTVNLSIAAHARATNPDLYLIVRQHHHSNSPLVAAFEPDGVFDPNNLVVSEALARIVTPLHWSFIDHVQCQDDAWAEEVLGRLMECCGTATPRTTRITIDASVSPAVVRWLAAGRILTLRDLLRDPDDRDASLPALPLLLVRDGESVYLPDPDLPLAPGDHMVFAGRGEGFDILTTTLHYDRAVQYVATGVDAPSSWVWRRLGPGLRASG